MGRGWSATHEQEPKRRRRSRRQMEGSGDMATHATSSMVLAALMSAAAVDAQCTTPWLVGLGSTGTNGPVADLVRWDPDGAGPLPG